MTSVRTNKNNPPNTAIITVNVHFKVLMILLRFVICVNSSICVLLMADNVSLSLSCSTNNVLTFSSSLVISVSL